MKTAPGLNFEINLRKLSDLFFKPAAFAPMNCINMSFCCNFCFCDLRLPLLILCLCLLLLLICDMDDSVREEEIRFVSNKMVVVVNCSIKKERCSYFHNRIYICLMFYIYPDSDKL